ncbi:HAD family hydrolase [Methanolobus profundi]|uniref:Haloacid dehalogenase superfamily, subfamily IA, variant 3 with third motif having DD or ED n=1 Tax=Methanolobus profundi TaxID=487685 RepID=A0A1I4P519_9EURY|nr:HAD family phosphatase [Methanolobus profundi]SFM22878.1 haloacid dehalogenase superfamily, subfamily IA, variant 3 with third motif having DD or ED [Methanolobus profundi]
MFKGIIFDSDGVLVNSMPYHAKAWVDVFAEFGIDVTEEEIYEIEGSNHVGVINIFFEKAGRTPEPDMYDAILEKKRAHFMENNRAEVFEGMYECLRSLKGKFKLAVASGADRTIVTSLMDRFYPDIFDAIISGEDVQNGKPDPEPYNRAVEKLGLKKKDCLVVENAPLGVESAKNAGMYCVGIPTYLDGSELQEADIVLKDHSELIVYLSDLMRIDR